MCHQRLNHPDLAYRRQNRSIPLQVVRPSKPRGNNSRTEKPNGSYFGFEAALWATADKIRGNLDAAEYKHVVLGLIFLKYISDAFEEKHAPLLKERGADSEDRDE